MLTLNKLYSILDEYAPFEISRQIIKEGGYDNSGILIKQHDSVCKIMFALDISVDVVKRAKRLGCDTVITHHPAIYNPITSLSIDNADKKALILAIKENINVISMHLNLDIADGGIDQSLAEGLGGKTFKILEYITEKNGYGREFEVEETTLLQYKNKVKTKFNTQKVITYGKKNTVIKKVASFCGAGGSSALNYSGDADLIVTSDLAHHVILALIERGKNLMIIPHYVAEIYGFKRFYERVKKEIADLQFTFFEDKRFR